MDIYLGVWLGLYGVLWCCAGYSGGFGCVPGVFPVLSRGLMPRAGVCALGKSYTGPTCAAAIAIFRFAITSYFTRQTYLAVVGLRYPL